MLKEFREFAMRGNVLDMAIGVIIGAAFGKIVTSFVADVITPPLWRVLSKVDFKQLKIALGEGVSLNYGAFINAVIDFVLIALATFVLVKAVNRLRRQAPPAPADTKECPFCISAVPIKATRCAHCTSELTRA
jgi:large conductance mechanosensitive channel